VSANSDFSSSTDYQRQLLRLHHTFTAATEWDAASTIVS
jgi:hypothetical protein